MAILNGYATLQEFINRYLSGATTTAAQNASIERIIQSVSRLIDLETHRQFWATASQARVFSPPKYTDFCWIDDAVTVTSVLLDTDNDGTYETTLVEGTDYVLKPDNAAFKGMPYTQIQMLHGSTYNMVHYDRSLQVTGTWGYCDNSGLKTEARIFSSASASLCFITNANSISAVATDDNADGVFETAWTVTTDYTAQPAGSSAYLLVQKAGSKSFPTAANGVQVTGAWNVPAAPDPIQEACYIQSYRQCLRSATPFGIAGSGEMGVMTAITKLDPDVARSLAPYIDYGGRE